MENDRNSGNIDEMQNARDLLGATERDAGWAEQRSMAVSDEFIRLEVQIATVLFAFSSLFISKLTNEELGNLSEPAMFITKLAFAASLFFLIASFSCGLLHLKNREKFCDKMLTQRERRYKKWLEVTQGKTTFEEAKAFHEGTSLGNGLVIVEPNWTWILQTICLGIGVAGLFILAIVFLFI